LAGTSTGGILAASYAAPSDEDPTKPKFNADEVAGFYPKYGAQIFSRSTSHAIWTAGGVLGPKYDGTAIDKIFGPMMEGKTLKDTVVPVCLTSWCLKHRCVHLLESGKYSEVVHEYLKGLVTSSSEDIPILTAVKATTAAPTYFPTVKSGDHNLADGGVVSVNPSLIAGLQALKAHPEQDVIVLSIGTGRHDAPAVSYEESSKWGIAQWLETLIGTLFETNMLMTNVTMRLLEADDRFHYIRINVNLPPEL
ncbi:unnamed protein product, partial [marine sediment metagenome]